MICTNCNLKIEKGQKYYRTSMGSHHTDCTKRKGTDKKQHKTDGTKCWCNPKIEQVVPIEINYSIVEQLFERCPFCGEKPNVFQIPEKRYGKDKPFGWVIECKNMGCIFKRSSPNQSFKQLMDEWNKRI